MLRKLIFAAVAAASALVAGEAVAAPPPVEALGALPTVRTVRISPSGKYFALVQNLPGQTAVKTFDTANGQMIGGIAVGKDQIIRDVVWHSDDRLLLFVAELADVRNYGDTQESRSAVTACRIMSIPRDGQNPVQLLPVRADRSNYLSGCDMIALHGTDPNAILLQVVMKTKDSGISSKNTLSEGVMVQSINATTGKAEVVEERGSRNTGGYMADAKGQLRLRFDGEGGSSVVYARLDGSTDWAEVHRQAFGAFDDASSAAGPKEGVMAILDFAPNPNQLYVEYWVGDRLAIGLFDLQSKKIISTVASDPKYDVDGVVELAHRIVGASIDRVEPEQVFFSDDWRKLQQHVEQSYPGHKVRIVSSSDDLTKHALYLEGPQWPGGIYVVLDLKSNEASALGALYPALNKENVGTQQYISYTARDGLKLDAYVTMPPGGGKNLPAIVLPHGGPRARDEGGFDWLSQYFATRGYVVIQPQYRGSAGFGSEFVRAGEQQWGLKMQDDVSDAAKYLVSSGLADASKICIMGWSYGGYAAMAGATLTPELYRCSIAGAGVSDLVQMLVWEGKNGNWQFGAARYWRRGIGDSVKDKDKLDKTSPAKHADQVRGPMLLIHGELDSTVPIFQSELMADALKAAGKTYEFVRLPGENHNISFASTRIKTLKAMDDFLAKYNPAH